VNCRHAFDAGDAVVHRDQQLRRALQRHGDDFRGEAVAELDKSLARLIPYQQLKGIDAAVDLLVTALEQRATKSR
jgi:hypothetical protein